MKSEVYNCDCMELMAKYPDGYFELAIVDPPYGINVNVNMGRRKNDKKSNQHKFAGNDSSIPDKKYFDELKRISKNQIIWGGNYMTEYLKPSPCWLMWDKKFSEEVSFAQFELAWTSFSSSAKKYDKSPNQQGRIHPTQKPVALFEYLIKTYTNEGDLVLDNCAGSGTTGVACKNLNRNFILIEQDENYCKIAEERLSK